MNTLSIIIPVFNEEKNIPELEKEIRDVLQKESELDYEILFVDDGSKDATWIEITKIDNPNVRAIRLRRNLGKSIALSVGFSHSTGNIVITMDGDLQDNPNDLPDFITKMQDGYDMVVGWRKTRHDHWEKKLPSKLFNKVVALLTKLPLHDMNIGYKAMSRDVVNNLTLYGEQHRYIPVIASSLGFEVTEIEVTHSPRKFGKSKYGIERYLRGFFDLLTNLLLTNYGSRPLHFFGMIGIFFSTLGALILTYLTILWFLGHHPIGNRPLLSFGILFFVFGIQFISLGLLSELMIYLFNSNNRSNDISKFIAERMH